MVQEIRKSSSNTARSRDSVNVEALLQGAERLSQIYAVAGANEKVRALRSCYREISASISVLEEQVYEQQSLLERDNIGHDPDGGRDAKGSDTQTATNEEVMGLTDHDFQSEEDEIRGLEARKRALENRVAGLEKDLGGLLG